MTPVGSQRINALARIYEGAIMKVTGWYSADQTPVRVGFYERWYVYGLYLHYWDGEFWRFSQESNPHWRQRADNPYPVWRGLAAPPKEQA